MLKSRQVDVSRLGELILELRSSPQSEVLTSTNQYEALRVRINDALVVVYTSGRVTYQESEDVESVLDRYSSAHVTHGRGAERRSLQPINVSLQERQKESLVEELQKIADSIPPTNKNEEYVFVLDDSRLIVYRNGTVYSPHGHPKYRELIINAIRTHPTHPEYDIVIGQDEVGKGELFGPIVVGSVALTQDETISLQLAGVRDSKDLNGRQIAELAEAVKKNSTARKIVSIDAGRFNQLYAQLKDEHKTLNDLLAWAHAEALSGVLSQLDGRTIDMSRVLVIIDEFDRVRTEERLARLVRERGVRVQQAPRAEDLAIAVASASILARAGRDARMRELQEALGVPLTESNCEYILSHPRGQEAIKLAFLKSHRPASVTNTVSGKACR